MPIGSRALRTSGRRLRAGSACGRRGLPIIEWIPAIVRNRQPVKDHLPSIITGTNERQLWTSTGTDGSSTATCWSSSRPAFRIRYERSTLRAALPKCSRLPPASAYQPATVESDGCLSQLIRHTSVECGQFGPQWFDYERCSYRCYAIQDMVRGRVSSDPSAE